MGGRKTITLPKLIIRVGYIFAIAFMVMVLVSSAFGSSKELAGVVREAATFSELEERVKTLL